MYLHKTLYALGCALALSLSISPAAASDAANDVENANPYIGSYVDHGRPKVALQPDPDGPKIFRGSSQTEDFHRMLEKGFDMIGYSNFDAGDVPPELVTIQAKNVKADVVLVYTTTLAGGTPPSVKIEQLKAQAAAAKANKDGASGDATEAAPKAPVNYSYFASYWVKLAPPVIGVHVNGPARDATPVGLTVLAVVIDSPAANAGIQDNDLLTRVGDIAMTSPQALSKAARRYAGKTVEVAYQRDGNDAKTSMTLNKSSQ